MDTDRYVKTVIFGMFKDRQENDMLMDAPTNMTWRELQQFARQRDVWRDRVRKLKQPRVVVSIGAPHSP